MTCWGQELGRQAMAQTQSSGAPCRETRRESDPSLCERRVSHPDSGDEPLGWGRARVGTGDHKKSTVTGWELGDGGGDKASSVSLGASTARWGDHLLRMEEVRPFRGLQGMCQGQGASPPSRHPGHRHRPRWGPRSLQGLDRSEPGIQTGQGGRQKLGGGAETHQGPAGVYTPPPRQGPSTRVYTHIHISRT